MLKLFPTAVTLPEPHCDPRPAKARRSPHTKNSPVPVLQLCVQRRYKLIRVHDANAAADIRHPLFAVIAHARTIARIVSSAPPAAASTRLRTLDRTMSHAG